MMARQSATRPEPAGRALLDGERQGRQHHNHQDDRSLVEGAGGDSEPQDKRNRAPDVRSIDAPHPSAAESAERRHHRRRQHGVRLGEPRLDAEQHGRRQERRGDESMPPIEPGEPGPIGREERRRSADE